MNKRGFTLIEMLVSVSLFTIAVTISLGALLIINNAYRITRAQQVAIDNLNFAIESMSRSIRTGFVYDCTGNVDPSMNSCSTNPGTAFSYYDFMGRIIVYRHKVIDGRGSIQQCVLDTFNTCDEDDFVDLTSQDIDIEVLKFYVLDADRSEGQPRLLIAIEGVAGRRDKERVEFSLQTTVTSRN
jgi:prepilin-type N-terminal cleavage/methylation domain-containing protein